jgi:hypothetical protein
MAEKTIFDYLNNIYNKGTLAYDKKAAPAYLISMWLSHDKNLVDITNTINEYQFFLSDDLIYQYYYHKVPQGKRYIKWVKKNEVDKKIKERYDAVRKEMMLSKREMEKYKMFTSLFENTKISDKKKKIENASSVFL